MAANLIVTSTQELLTIKVPPTTAASRKKLVVVVDTLLAEFEKSCDSQGLMIH
jgi:hypothetical protein